MYGGDEVGAMVIDIGSSNTKIGYAGHDAPRVLIPTVTGVIDSEQEEESENKTKKQKVESKLSQDMDVDTPITKSTRRYFFDTQLNIPRKNMEIYHPVSHGLIKDMDSVSSIIDYTLNNLLSDSVSEHPFLFSEPSITNDEQRKWLSEIMFEKYQSPALFYAKDVVLSAFSLGRSTALVVDTGGGLTRSVAVHDGFILKKGLQATKYAGDLLTKLLFFITTGNSLEEKNIEYIPRYAMKREIIMPSTTQSSMTSSISKITRIECRDATKSLKDFSILEIVRHLKESVCRISETAFDPQSDNIAQIPVTSYELPDGKSIEFGGDRFLVPEILFNPFVHIKNNFKPLDLLDGVDIDNNYEFQGIPKMTKVTVDEQDPDLRKELFANLILTGANSGLPGIGHRIYRELSLMLPSAYKVKILHPSNSNERNFGQWIGGSILASLGTFHQMWVSKSEYEENGIRVLNDKCP